MIWRRFRRHSAVTAAAPVTGGAYHRSRRLSSPLLHGRPDCPQPGKAGAEDSKTPPATSAGGAAVGGGYSVRFFAGRFFVPRCPASI